MTKRFYSNVKAEESRTCIHSDTSLPVPDLEYSVTILPTKGFDVGHLDICQFRAPKCLISTAYLITHQIGKGHNPPEQTQ